MTLLDRVLTCHAWDAARYRPFLIDGVRYGRIDADFAARLADYPELFEAAAVRLRPALDDPATRTQAVAEAMAQFRLKGDLPYWRGELYPVTNEWGRTPVMAVERGAVARFGMRAYGIHLNGLVRTDDGVCVWVAKRAASRKVAPGRWDQMVAGGQPAGLSVRENVTKECAEEAGVPAALAETAQPVGALSYLCEQPDGLRDDVAFCFDLWLPEDFVPENRDGEVERFELWPLERALAVVRETDAFKFNCALVVIDLALRYGAISPDEPGYAEIRTALGRQTPASEP